MTAAGAAAVCCSIASTGLRPVEPFTCSDDLWPGVLEIIERDRLAGLALESTRRGELLATESQRAHLLSVHERSMRWCLRLEARLGEVETAMHAAGVPALVLKGPSVAHLDYDDASHRVFRDLDLLVPSTSLQGALDVVASIGFRPMQSEPRRGFQGRFGKGRSTTDEHGVEVDLHRTLAAGPFGAMLPMKGIWASTESYRVGGVELRAPDRTWRFLHACLHAVLTGRGDRLWILRDVAQLHTHPALDIEAVLRLASEARAEAVVALAIENARGAMAVEGPMTEWAATRPATSRELRLIGVYEPGRSEGARTLATLQVMPGFADRLRLARSMLVPEAEFLEARHLTRRAWLARGLRSLRGRRNGR